MSFRRLGTRDTLWAGEMQSVEVDGRRVLLVDVDGHVSAFVDRCAHQGVPLSEGALAAGVLTCRVHEWQYDARTGVGLNPACARLERLRVELRGEEIWVDVADRPGAPGRGTLDG